MDHRSAIKATIIESKQGVIDKQNENSNKIKRNSLYTVKSFAKIEILNKVDLFLISYDASSKQLALSH